MSLTRVYFNFDFCDKLESLNTFLIAWIGSFSTGFQFLLCIVGSVLTDLFNPRRTGIVGGILSSVSLLGCAFITDIK